METVLMTSTGSVAADITLKSLKRMGFRVVGCNIYPKEWIVESCDADAFYQAPPVADSQRYLEFIRQICQQENIKYIFPMIDYEVDLFNVNREWFDENGVTLCISPKQALDIIRDKKRLADFVYKECKEVKAIPTEMLRDIKELKWDFPVVCKPFNGRSSQGLKFIYNKQEWDEFVAVADKDRYIVEPYIEGPNVVVEVVRQRNPHKVVALPRRELISTPHGCSLTVEVFHDEKLENSTKILADKLDVWGDVNFEYIMDENGEFHLLECNPRFSAGCEFSCMGGYDCVENHMKCFQNKEIEDYHFKHNMIIARKYEEYITAVDTNEKYCKTFR